MSLKNYLDIPLGSNLGSKGNEAAEAAWAPVLVGSFKNGERVAWRAEVSAGTLPTIVEALELAVLPISWLASSTINENNQLNSMRAKDEP